MKAIILAAGKGSRLNGIIADAPKCLLQVGETSLLEYQILTLRRCGIDDIAVVVGYNAELVRNVIGSGVQFVDNEIYSSTNSLYSLWLTHDLLHDGFIVMNGDVLFHPQMLSKLLRDDREDALLISYRNSMTSTYGDEEMKVKIADGKIIEISKQIIPSAADGENVGIGKFGPAGAKVLIEKMNNLISNGAERQWAPRAFQDFASVRPLYAIDIHRYPWIEIDFPEDYRRAIEVILPRITSSGEVRVSRPLSAEKQMAIVNSL
jgi:choline kinase